MNRITSNYALRKAAVLTTIGDRLQPAVLLLIRVAWGWQLVEAGHGHLTNVAGTARNFAEWGIPLPTLNVYMAGGVEMIGGGLLMLGLASRLIAIPLFFNFCVAYLTAGRDEVVHILSQNPDAFINDAAFPFLVMSLLILAFGPGRYSLDAAVRRLLLRNVEPGTSATPRATMAVSA